MGKKEINLNMLTAVLLGTVLLAGMVWKAFVPNAVLPKLDIPAMTALVLMALLLEYFLAGRKKRVRTAETVLAALTFLLLPAAAGMPDIGMKTAVCGAAVFTVLTWMFDLAADRLETAVGRRGAMIPTALIIYLSCQGFLGMFP